MNVTASISSNTNVLCTVMGNGTHTTSSIINENMLFLFGVVSKQLLLCIQSSFKFQSLIFSPSFLQSHSFFVALSYLLISSPPLSFRFRFHSLKSFFSLSLPLFLSHFFPSLSLSQSLSPANHLPQMFNA